MTTDGTDSDRGFGADTTTEEVLAGVDLTGRIAVVTGAASGLGQETARALAAHGATVVLAGRDVAKLDEARAAIAAEVDGARLDTAVVDLASLASVRAAAADLSARFERIDLLICNAGVMACPLARTAEGFEMQFGTNHLGHFLLTNLLVDRLLAAPAPRVVALSSAGHRESPIRWDDPNFEHTEYHNWLAYGQSKTANALFALELDRRYRDRGLHAYSVHPGVIPTPLARHLTAEDIEWLSSRARNARRPAESDASGGAPSGGGGMRFKSVEAGAATTVWAATAPELDDHGGAYLADCQVAPLLSDEHQGANALAPYACDPDEAARLWTLSEELVGLAGDDRP